MKAYRATSRHWKKLDQHTPTGNTHQCFDTMNVLRAIKAACEGFNIPGSVCPSVLNPALCSETKLVLQGFDKQYGGAPVVFGMTALNLLESLFGIAMSTNYSDGQGDTIAKRCMLPNYSEFLTLWLTRVVNLLTNNTCKKKGIRHAGLHQHSDGQHYNSLTPDIGDGFSEGSDAEQEKEENRDIEADLNAVETTMKDTHIS